MSFGAPGWESLSLPPAERHAPQSSDRPGLTMVTIDDVRQFAITLPRTTEALVGGRVKFRDGRLVYLSFSRDGQVMGFAFPKEERDWLVGGTPDKFMQPHRSDLRYNWVLVRMPAIGETEKRELVIDAWRMAVPKSVAAAYS